jgi:hypothetical protein
MSEEPDLEGLMQIGFGFWASKCLFSAVELDVFTQLAKGRLDAETLVARLGLHRRGARDFLDALVALGLLTRNKGLYANTLETDFYLDRSKSSYIGGIIEMANKRLYPFWGALSEALRTGLPQNETREGEASGVYELYNDSEWMRTFLQGMTGLSKNIAKEIAKKFPWNDYRTFVDIGAGQGGLPVQVALTLPHLTGGGFDLPAVEPVFEEYVDSFGLKQRLRFYPGDFCTDPFPQADVLVMGHILHGESLKMKCALLGKAFDAIPRDGSLIVYDMMIDDDRSVNALAFLSSLNMLIETPGGFEYTGAECRSWLRKAGFRETRVEHLVGPESMVIAIK